MRLKDKAWHNCHTDKKYTVVMSLVMVGLSTLLFSVIAPISAISTKVDPILLLSAGSFVALFVHIPFVKNLKQRISTCRWQIYLLIVAGGAINAWAYVLLTIALRQSDNAIIQVLILELYPVVTVILAGILLAQQHIRQRHYFWMIVCVFGVLILMLDGQEISFHGLKANMANGQNANFLMLFTVLFYSLGNVFTLRASRLMGGTASDGIFTSFLIRIVHFLVTLPFASWALMEEMIQQQDFINLGYIFVYGASALALSNILYFAAVNINKSNLLHIMLFMGPVFSTAWLALLGLGNYNLATVIGGGLIILSVLRVTLSK